MPYVENVYKKQIIQMLVMGETVKKASFIQQHSHVNYTTTTTTYSPLPAERSHVINRLREEWKRKTRNKKLQIPYPKERSCIFYFLNKAI